MKRREFIAGIGSAAAWPLAARAQQTDSMRRTENDAMWQTPVAAFREVLAKLGSIEGRNLRIDLRSGGSEDDRFRAYAAELMSLAPDVIVVSTGVVMAGAGDVANNGMVKDIARPEGNITGVVNLFGSIGSKWLELLKQAAPQLQRVGLIYNARVTPNSGYAPTIENAAHLLAVQTVRLPYRNAVDIVRAVDAFAAEPNGGLIQLPPPPTPADRDTILQLAAQHRLPAIYADTHFVAEGGLMVYGSETADLCRRASSYVDRILRGAKVSEPPVEYPTKFELVINLKTARVLGLTIPETLLATADVIE